MGDPSPSSTFKKTCRTAAEDLPVEEEPVMERLNLTNKQVGGCWEEDGYWWKLKEADKPDNPSRELSRF